MWSREVQEAVSLAEELDSEGQMESCSPKCTAEHRKVVLASSVLPLSQELVSFSPFPLWFPNLGRR